MYTRDLMFLLHLLQSSQQNGLLLVEAPDQSNSNDASWQGQIQLVDGTVKACVVFESKTGRVMFTNNEAINWLVAQEKLSWHIEEDMQASIPSPAPPREVNIDTHQSQTDWQFAQVWAKRRKEVFHRTVRGNTIPLHALSNRDHRQVFALIDGHRTTEEVVQLLRKPPEIILRLLQDLLSAGFIS